MAATDLPVSPGHPFYTRLNSILDGAGFDRFAETACAGLLPRHRGPPPRARHRARPQAPRGVNRIQQLVHDKAMFAPIMQLAAMGGFGPRVEESGLGLITGFPFSGPYEDVKLKGK